MMASTTEALLVVALAVAMVYVSWVWFKQRRNLILPPGPTTLPIIGSALHLLGSHLPKSMMDLSRRYGPVMSVWFGQKLCIVASTPDAAKEFLKHQDANFCSRPPLRASELIMPGDFNLHDLTPESKNFKKILVTELTSAKRLQASKHMRAEEIAYMLSAVSKETGPFQVVNYTNILSLNLVTRMVLCRRLMGAEQYQSGEPASAHMVAEMKEFMDMQKEFVSCFNQVHPQEFFNVPGWFDPQGLDTRFRKARARLDAFYKNVLSQHKEVRRKNPISDAWQQTLLDVLLEQLENPEYDYTEDHIKSFIWDALAAGVDTTTLTTEWAMAEVLRNPLVVKEARSELDNVVGLERTVQESDIPELKYIQAIVKESLRLHPPVPFLIPHQSINSTTAFGYHIPAKTWLFVNLWAIGRDPESWERPMEFLPERFLGGAPHATTQFQGQHFELLTFGTGRRQCPGIAFAATAVHLQVASLLHAFDFSFPDGMAPQDLDMSEGKGLTLFKRDRLVVVAKPRLPSRLY